MPEAQARHLMRQQRSAALATAAQDAASWPYASLVTTACDTDGSPILLLSNLADHTRNLKAEPRASLLFEAAAGRANPQTGPRVSVIGTIAPADEPHLRRRFLARHPTARLYAGFADFGVYRMQVVRAHFVAGFGRSVWIERDHFCIPAAVAAAFAGGEEEALAQLNGDRHAALQALAGKRSRRSGDAWMAVGLDPDGIDLCCGTATARLSFLHAIPAPTAAAEALDRLLQTIARRPT